MATSISPKKTNFVYSSEWKALTNAAHKATGKTAGEMSEFIDITRKCYEAIIYQGLVVSRPTCEKVADKLGIPIEDALLACGYSNQNIVRGYRRYLYAIKTNTPMKIAENGVATIGKTSTKPSSKDLVAALSELVGEFEGLRTENQQMSAKLSKIQAAFA